MNVVAVIPFRLASSRFPGKPLVKLAGVTLLERSLALASALPASVTILTAPEEDYREAARCVELSRFRFRFVPTSTDCRSATERVLALSRSEPGDRFVSLPIDEGALRADEVGRVLGEIAGAQVGICTLVCRFYCMEDARSPLSAKVVVADDGRVLWMSRAVIPVPKSGEANLDDLRKHVGVFVFGRASLDRLWELRERATRFDAMEGLEQLRWLELGVQLTARQIDHAGFGIDAPEQVALLEQRMAGCSPTPTKSA